MAELILPGVFIEVRPEGLIVPGQITVGNLGVVGTASKGEVGKATLVSDYGDAVQTFGAYDSFIDPATRNPRTDSLTLVRALEQAFAFGATTVFAVRVAGAAKAKSSFKVRSATGDNVTLNAKSEGTWANDLQVNIGDAEEDGFIEAESVPTSGVGALTLKRTRVVKSARNRVTHSIDATGVTRVIGSPNILYAGGLPDDDAAAPAAGQVKIDRTTGVITFAATEGPAAADILTAAYSVEKTKAVKVTLRLGQVDEVYTVVDGRDLAADINALSAWVTATEAANAGELPTKSAPIDSLASFKGGANGEAGADYKAGLDLLLNEDVHIIVAAGQDDGFGNKLDAHCQQASTDVIKRDRIAVVGSKLNVTLDQLRGHTLASDRVIFVAPGIKATDAAATPPNPRDITLPGAYAAAAVAGLLASFSPHISLTNKVLAVDGLEKRFTSPELTQLVQSRVLALEQRQGFRVVKGITTSTNSAFAQITTRRIVDYAKYGVRSAATPYIGLLNNERVRGALKATVNSFLAEMVLDEMLVSYELTVSATRDDERKGIARVTMVLRPTFSIDFIKVTMFLE
jgi:Phage tail sheath C-terminal domain/Phage tail sheath protein subtilisin-like domain